MKDRLKNLFLVLFVVVSMVIVLELLMQFLENRGVYVGEKSHYDIYRFDPKLGWALEPNAEGVQKRREFEYLVKNNSFGMRYREFSKEKDSKICRVAVLGDSFTWGMGVIDSERFTDKVEKFAGHKIEMLNFGVSGYAPIQYYLLLDEVIKYNPDIVLIAFCLGNDFADNVLWNRYGYYKPYAEINEDSSLEIKGYPLPNRGKARFYSSREILPWVEKNSIILYRLRSLFNKFSDTFFDKIEQKGLLEFKDQEPLYLDNPDTIEIVNKANIVNAMLLKKIKEDLEANKVKLVVLEIPTKLEYGIAFVDEWNSNKNRNLKAHTALVTTLDTLNIDHIELIDEITPEDFWIYDGHWRASGHEKAAKKTFEFLSDSGFIK